MALWGEWWGAVEKEESGASPFFVGGVRPFAFALCTQKRSVSTLHGVHPKPSPQQGQPHPQTSPTYQE